MKRSFVFCAVLLAAAAPAAADVPIEEGLAWFPRVPGPGDQRYLIHTNHCGDPVGVVGPAASLSLVDADEGRWRLDYQADTLLCGTPPPFESLMAMAIPDAVDGVPVHVIDVVREHLSSDALDASWTTRVPERVGVPPSIVGTWFAAGHAEQGFLITLTQHGEAAVSWNTYGGDGTQRWLSGVAPTAGDASTFSVPLVDTGTGTFAGMPQTPDAPTPWGSINVEYMECGMLQAAWAPDPEVGLPSGGAVFHQLTAPYGDPCDLEAWAQSQQAIVVPVEVDTGP